MEAENIATIGNYKITELLRKTPEGVFYNAVEKDSENRVLIKIYHPTLTWSEDILDEFFNLVSHLRFIEHEHLLPILDFGKHEDLPYVVFGGESTRLLDERHAPPTDRKELLSFFRKIADALDYLHKQEILHGSLNTENVVIDENGEPKLFDHGLSGVFKKLLAENLGEGFENLSISNLKCASPEQALGRNPTRASDVYSFGVVFYYYVFGKFPFDGRYAPETAISLLESSTAKVDAIPAHVTGDVLKFIQKCIQLEPGARFSRFSQVTDVLDRMRAGKWTRFRFKKRIAAKRRVARRAWQYAAGFLLLAGLAAAYLLYPRGDGGQVVDSSPPPADNQPILSDFSLMRIIEEEETRDMTGTNVGLGSPAYISPEQGKGLTVDFRADIYSLGVIFFEMVTGRKLFYASSSMEIVIQHIMADPPKPRSILPSLPRSIEEIILNSLSKDRDKRYQTMSEFADALKDVVQAMTEAKKPASRPRISPMLAGVSALGIILFIAGAFWIFGNRKATPPASTTAPAPASTAQATSTPTATPSLAITKTVVNTPDESASRITLPSIPILPGSALPAGAGALEAGNAASIVELARWGTPRINEFVFIQNDALLLAATSAGVYYLDPRDLSYRYFFDTEGALTTLTVSKDGEWVVTGDDKGTVAVWNVLDGKRLYRLEGTAQRIELLELSPDKSKLAFTDSNNRIHLWNLRQDLHYPFERKHLLKINRIAFTADGGTLLSGGDDFKIYIWDVSSGNSETSITADQKIMGFDLKKIASRRHAMVLRRNDTFLLYDWTLAKNG